MWIWVKEIALLGCLTEERRNATISGHSQVDAVAWVESLVRNNDGEAPAAADDARWKKEKREGRGKVKRGDLAPIYKVTVKWHARKSRR